MEYKKYDGNGYAIHTIKTDKFKNCSIEVIFRDKIKKEKITEHNMLVDLLMHSSLKYPKRKDVAIELENLYSSFIRGTVTRLGNASIISFAMDFLNPKYCEKGFLKDVIKMTFEMINHPNIIDGEFDQRSFNIIKSRIKSDIESLKENATRYAFRRALDYMDSESPSSYYMVGSLEDLEKITPASLVKTYEEMINNYICDIYVVGNLDMDEVTKIIKREFKLESNNRKEIELNIENKLRDKVQDFDEVGEYEQDTIVLIYNIDNATKREKNYVLPLINYVIGGGGLSSRLYKYLREENSLCYLTTSLYQKYDGLEMVYAGINKKDKKKCVKLINKTVEDMATGNFEDTDINNAKRGIFSALKVSQDSAGGIINEYFFHNIADVDLNEEKIKGFETITREEVMECAKKIKLNTIYLLGGEDK